MEHAEKLNPKESLDIISDAIAMRDFGWDSSFRIERHILPEQILSIEFGTDYQDPDDIQLPEWVGEFADMKERIGYTLIKCYFTKEKSKRKIIITKGLVIKGVFCFMFILQVCFLFL